MRAIWTGAIGFGLVNIPIKIYSATQENRPDFDLLERKSLDRVRYKRVNERTGKEVHWDDIVKGHYFKDRYIVVEDADFEDASPEKTKTINLQSFVNESDIDSIYFETPYYLSPQKGNEKAYSLLYRALSKTKKAALSTFVMRSTESLAIIRPHDKLLLLNRLRFQEEIRPASDVGVTLSSVSKAEMDMAVKLIKQHTGDFNVEEYRDLYSKELMKLIRAKAKGKRPTVRKLKAQHKGPTELLEQLKASLA